jgi:NAD(P)-dependent dehydrogenase (short-subunit alcohol dehydrogenase family)
VVIACRTVTRGETAAAQMHGDVTVARLDLADLASIRAFAETIDYVDVLVNDAAVLGLPLARTLFGSTLLTDCRIHQNLYILN